MLADQALAHPDGKLYITGGGIRSLNVTTLPARYGQLALALQLVFGPDEVGNQHHLRITARQPDGQELRGEASIPITPVVSRLDPHGVTELPVVFTMRDLIFPLQGEYYFS